MARTQMQSFKLYLYLLGALIIILIFSAAQNGLQLRRYNNIRESLVSISDNEQANDILRAEFQWVGEDSTANKDLFAETIQQKRQEMWGKLAMLGMITAAEGVLFFLYRKKKKQQDSSSNINN